jgi:hypothetical protein
MGFVLITPDDHDEIFLGPDGVSHAGAGGTDPEDPGVLGVELPRTLVFQGFKDILLHRMVCDYFNADHSPASSICILAAL